ncbi:Rab3 GTPase-activating protein non-catalytic subunit isoform 1 [Theobroma cacao]|uniref:Rab3 GTPase-activating protein non-catalytic subunit isoform 1 n=1 Tax=Theobroma cacao TaxID=3641 RepID=S1RTX1_THECC|nr:Rab3 GTPase-activating protein non-catalytic subunit isoform 1 [Theobroma cacao]
MSKRSNHHLTDLGCIAGEDLSEFGAGEEGWLAPDASTTLLCALDAHSLAIANRSLILILGWSDPDEPRVQIRPELSPFEAEHITAIEWLVFDEIKVIAVGTSRGFILVYSLRGDLIHRQMVYPGRIVKLRVRGTKKDLTQDISSEEVCVVIPGVIARFDGSDIQSSQRYYCAVTIGDDAVISAFRLSEDRTRSLIGAILSKVVPATFSRIASFSKMIWRSEQMPKRKSEEKPQSFARASPLTCLKDHPRKGEKLTLSPSGTLAAITDSLGRILLLDTQTLVVVRLWKGYCDASCFFMEMLVNKEAIGSGCSYYEPGKSDYCLCLAIHAR